MDQLFIPAGSYIEHFFGSAKQVSDHGGINPGHWRALHVESTEIPPRTGGDRIPYFMWGADGRNVHDQPEALPLNRGDT